MPPGLDTFLGCPMNWAATGLKFDRKVRKGVVSVRPRTPNRRVEADSQGESRAEIKQVKKVPQGWSGWRAVANPLIDGFDHFRRGRCRNLVEVLPRVREIEILFDDIPPFESV